VLEPIYCKSAIIPRQQLHMAKNTIWKLFKEGQLLGHNNLPVLRGTFGHFCECCLHHLPHLKKLFPAENGLYSVMES
jgi:hypothetical protein